MCILHALILVWYTHYNLMWHFCRLGGLYFKQLPYQARKVHGHNVLRVSLLSLSMIFYRILELFWHCSIFCFVFHFFAFVYDFLLDFATVLTVWYFLFFNILPHSYNKCNNKYNLLIYMLYDRTNKHSWESHYLISPLLYLVSVVGFQLDTIRTAQKYVTRIT